MGKHEIFAAKSHFEQVQVAKFFHLATIAAVPFRNLHLFEPVRRGLEAVDSLLLRLPGIRWQAWMAVFILSNPKKATNVAKA